MSSGSWSREADLSAGRFLLVRTSDPRLTERVPLASRVRSRAGVGDCYHGRMRKGFAACLVVMVVALVSLLGARPASARPDYTRRTGKQCAFCHPTGGWTLNEAGKYYKDHSHSLKGYEPAKPKS